MLNIFFIKLQSAAISCNRVTSTFKLFSNHQCEIIICRTFKETKIQFFNDRNKVNYKNGAANGSTTKNGIGESKVFQQLKKTASIWKESLNGESLCQKEKFKAYIRLLGTKDVKFSQLFPIIQNSKYDFKDFDTIYKLKDKIFEIAILLKCSPDESYKFILKHEFLAQSKLSTIGKKVDLIIENGISLLDLKRDLWVLSYTFSKLEARISQMKNLNLPMKCWMLRCQESTLHRSWEKRKQDKEALIPFTNSREYLCNRLNMNECQLDLFISKHPAVLKINMAKLKNVLDYLLNEGFTPSQIYATPRILCHSISTIKARLSILRVYDCEPRTLALLCLSSKAFDSYVQKISKPSLSQE